MFSFSHRQQGTCLLTAMPLVVICGQPCSGKSTVATALAEVSSNCLSQQLLGLSHKGLLHQTCLLKY